MQTVGSSTPTYGHSNGKTTQQDSSQHSQQPSNSDHQATTDSHSTVTATPITTPSSSAPRKAVPSFKDLSSITSRQPVPSKVWNCDISREKDAMSAMNRAKAPICKELIHNVTCLQKAGLLYDTSIGRTCPLGPNPGTGLSYSPAKGVGAKVSTKGGAPVRIVFLFSVHGRAVRQVKRLFKALYHSDHYYYVHVDSVSSPTLAHLASLLYTIVCFLILSGTVLVILIRSCLFVYSLLVLLFQFILYAE